jgi:hypothetical protein
VAADPRALGHPHRHCPPGLSFGGWPRERSRLGRLLSGFPGHDPDHPGPPRGPPPPPAGTTGLYHLAIVYPTRADLAGALRRLIAAGIDLDGASDHGVSEALYLHDPDHNGVELYWDRPEAQWPRTADGTIAMRTDPLDLQNLLAEAKAA